LELILIAVMGGGEVDEADHPVVEDRCDGVGDVEVLQCAARCVCWQWRWWQAGVVGDQGTNPPGDPEPRIRRDDGRQHGRRQSVGQRAGR
jgi:hypothetical protein